MSASLHTQFGHKAAPRLGEKGHRPLSAARLNAERWGQMLIEAALELADSDMAPIWRGVLECWDWGGDHPEMQCDELLEDSLAELAFMLGVAASPLPQTTGRPLEELAVALMKLAGRVQFDMPRTIAAELIADAIEPTGKLRLVNVSKEDARAFIARHHSIQPEANTRGLMYALGVMRGGRLVAVATAVSPTAPWKGKGRSPVCPQRNVVEVSRVASDGTVKGAASKLVARLIDLLPTSGREGEGCLLVTYQYLAERGSTYRALRDKGLRPVELVLGSPNKRGGQRGPKRGFDAGAVDKIRWEAGPSALPADWTLLEMAGDSPVVHLRQTVAQLGGEAHRRGADGMLSVLQRLDKDLSARMRQGTTQGVERWQKI